jgi:conjugal transfer/entry exclusion protein
MDDVCFTVDANELDVLSGRLNDLATTMGGIDQAVSQYDPLDLDPDGKVLAAAQKFADNWASNLKQVAADVSDLRDRLGAAGTGYREVEANISQAVKLPGSLPGVP